VKIPPTKFNIQEKKHVYNHSEEKN